MKDDQNFDEKGYTWRKQRYMYALNYFYFLQPNRSNFSWLLKSCQSLGLHLGLFQVASLKKALKPAAQDDSVARAFLRCLVRVIGGYRDGLQWVLVGCLLPTVFRQYFEVLKIYFLDCCDLLLNNGGKLLWHQTRS